MARVDVKIVLLGQQSVGKSCLLDRYVNGFFEGQPRNTIGAAFAAKKVTVQSGRTLSLGIWDTAGAERFQSISRMYYRGSKAAIICFAPSSQQSFIKAQYWAKEVQDNEAGCRIYFAMTKCDLLEHLPNVGVEPMAEASPADQADMAATPDSMAGSETSGDTGRQQQEVSDEDIKLYAASHESKVFVTSAKTGIGVSTLFSTIAEDLASGASETRGSQRKHQHDVRPASPNYLQHGPSTGPSSPLASNTHNSTYSRTRRKYLPSCCS